jgi:uncharacterized protein YecT (DUF1311 family)
LKPPRSRRTIAAHRRGIFAMPFFVRWVLLALALRQPLGAATAAGLPVAKKSVTVKNRQVEITVAYPVTGNKAIDAAILGYVHHAVDEFKGFATTEQPGDGVYTLETDYSVERNDGKMFAVLFSSEMDTHGAHPSHGEDTFNFLLPDGAQVFLPEIVDGSRGLKKVAELASADLIKNIGSGTEPASDPDTIRSGTTPIADNFKVFVLLPGKLHLFFPEYQVASYAAGPQEAFIPLAALKTVIRADWRAPAPSFDCARAATAIEHAICANAALARLDRQVAEAYQVAIRNAYEPAAQEQVRQGQRDWVAKRNKTCGTVDTGSCLTKFYRDRLAALNKPSAQ